MSGIVTAIITVVCTFIFQKIIIMFPVNKDILVLRFELYSDLDFNCQRLYSKKISCIIYFFIHHFIKKILTAYGKHMINKFIDNY